MAKTEARSHGKWQMADGKMKKRRRAPLAAAVQKHAAAGDKLLETVFKTTGGVLATS